ncbi:carbohydrate esterase family 3 protein [Fusarium bulbicola]|nr:carbohydrate esterase family 3 protein [Fusarium bulbicola]
MRRTSEVLRLAVFAAFSCGLLRPGLVLGQETDTISYYPATSTANAPSRIDFSSAVHLASSISWSLHQLSTIPALPLPTNISAVPEYEIVSRLAPALPPVQAGVSFGPVNDMIAGMIASTNVSSPGLSVVARQSTLRVMIIGDSMSQGREGDYTWRYRIWQFFKQNGIDVEMVGPYKARIKLYQVPPDPPTAPSPPALYGKPVPSSAPKTSGGYAADVDEAFLSNCNHFSAWPVAVDKGLIESVLQSTPADLILFMLGFIDMGWFYSDAAGTLDSFDAFVTNAQASNPNVKIAMADVPQRSFIQGRNDLVKNTEIYNKLLPDYISKWSTKQSPIHLVPLAENYDCQPSGCPAGTDGLHPNAEGEFQIASIFSKTLVKDFNLGKDPVQVPGQGDSALARALPQPSNFRVFSSPQGVTATWDPGNYDVTVSINGGANTYSPTTTLSNRWDSQWPLEGWTYTVSVRARYGDYSVGPYTSKLSAKATPKLSDPPQNVKVEPGDDGFTVTWDPPTGSNTDSIVEYNILYWDWSPDDCEIITGAAFTSSPAVIKGLTPGRNYLIAPVTWNENGQGLPFFANNAVPGAGTPPVPSDLKILSTDPTTVHITWTGSDSAGGYHVWNRNVNEKDGKFAIVANVTGSTCLDDFLLFPGTWNYEWCVSAYSGNEESQQGPAKLAPSVASGNKDSPGPTCPAAAAWCPGGGGVSVPPGQSGTLPPTTVIQTVTSNGMTLTITSLPTSTDDDVTSTMTTVPPGVSLEDFTDFPVTTNIWITTTGSDSSTTVVPVILPCPTCEPVVVWDTPEIPRVKFRWPKFPELPTFHLPCVKVFGVKVAGQCPKPEGPAPVNDDPPPHPRPSGNPPDTEADPCHFDTRSGMCDNGNYPVYDASSNTINCDVPSDELGSKITSCQRKIDSKMDAVKRYKGHYTAKSKDRPKGGWKLQGCEVEEYPFGSGNPDRSKDAEAVLRLIPGGPWNEKLENQLAGDQLRQWLESVAEKYNTFQEKETGTNPKIDTDGIVCCVDFDPSFTKYLPEDLVDENFCAARYGPEFTLVNNLVVNKVRTWDPWFDVPDTDRKKPELMHYLDSKEKMVKNPTDDDYAVYALVPPTYCRYPSPGKYDWDQDTNSWNLDSDYQALGRQDGIVANERCTDPPANTADDDRALVKRNDSHFQATANIQERMHARDLAGRQGSSGGFLDANVYKWLGCSQDDGDNGEEDDADGDPCDDDSNPCGDDDVDFPDDADPSLDPLPASGVTTRPVTLQPHRTTTAPSYVSCSTHNADPDGGIARGYCVCSGSTFSLSTDSNITPANRCAYTSPLPKTTISVSQLPTGPTASTPSPSPSPYVLVIYTREIEVAGHGGVTDTWWWDCRPFNKGEQSDSDVCAIKDNPIAYSTAVGRASPALYPTSLATFSLHGHASCSYQGPNTATVGSVVCDDGLTAKCTAAPEASQTSFVDCTDGDEVQNGLARDL